MRMAKSLRVFLARIRALFSQRKAGAELDVELETHLALLTERFLRQGMSPEDAAAAARRQFGNRTLLRERHREARSFMFFANLWRDVRYGLRMLRKDPGFSSVAILTLALGIGANTAIFSLVNTALFKQVSARNPNQLVSVFYGDPHGNGLSNHSYPDYLDYREQSADVLSGLAAYTTDPANLVIGQTTERVNVGLVTDNYFSVLGVNPIAGREFLPGENSSPGNDFTAVISESLWRREFGGTKNLTGSTISLNNSSYSVIGVLPDRDARMASIVRIDVFVPAVMEGVIGGDKTFFSNRQNKEFMVVGRLRPETTLDQAQAKFNLVAANLQKRFPEEWTDNKHTRPSSLVPYGAVPFELRGLVVGFAGLLMAGVGVVLLIACNNLASFLLARGLTRKKEVAVRLALGTSRRRLVQQFLTENLLVALLGGALGFFLAFWCKGLLARFAPNIGVPLVIDLSIDGRVLGFSIIVTLLTAGAFGLAPALQASKIDPSEGLKEADQTQTVSKTRARLRNGLMIGQVAISLVLLMCAGSFLGAIFKLRSIDLGFDPNKLALLSVDPSLQGYSTERAKEFVQLACARLAAVPGVEAVAVAARVPMGLSRVRDQIVPSATGDLHKQVPVLVGWNSVGPGYFKTMRIPILRGRAFGAQDRDDAPRVAVVNDALARKLWPNEDPVGKQIRETDGVVYEVVGIAKTGKYDSIGKEPLPFVYFPLDQSHGYSSELTFHIRTQISPVPLLDAFRNKLQALNPTLTVYDVETMNEHLADSLVLVRMGAILLGSFGGLGLGLAVLGLYGLMNYHLKQRTREMGIRISLGATPRNVLNLILMHGVKLTMIGAAIGFVIGVSTSTLITSQLYGASPVGLAVLAAMAAIQLGVALLACWIPARRAAGVQPMEALRHE